MTQDQRIGTVEEELARFIRSSNERQERLETAIAGVQSQTTELQEMTKEMQKAVQALVRIEERRNGLTSK